MSEKVVKCPKCGKEGNLTVYGEPDCNVIVGKVVHSIKEVTGLMGRVEEVPDDVCFITVDELFGMNLSEEYKQRSQPYQALLRLRENEEIE